MAADPDGSLTARVFRSTFIQFYDGRRTGRYRWDQLFKRSSPRMSRAIRSLLAIESRAL
ncbi:NaeI family type II restriction endonuclease [Arthrobacter sp. MI7-26]|nr:NaeI family type II restriction endonuclease [Arthrobacter sp. MI7-26]